MNATTLEQYLDQYADTLARKVEDQFPALHTPGVDQPMRADLLRPPYEAQAHVITAMVHALDRQNGVLLSGECGVGKTLVAQAICNTHARESGKGAYRALVFCPPHLLDKWEDEIKRTVRNATVRRIENFKQLCQIKQKNKNGPVGRQWWLLTNTKAKLGSGWRAAYCMYRDPTSKYPFRNPVCPRCNATPTRKVKEQNARGIAEYVDEPLTIEDLCKKKHTCSNCNEPLWCYCRKFDRWPCATYIHQHMKGFFQYLVIDESHQVKADESQVAIAMGSLVAACDKVICMTGTVFGGYATHVRPIMFRIAPQTLRAEGLTWDKELPFVERYGRLERIVNETYNGGVDLKYGRGKTKTKTTTYPRPGIMPNLFCRHLVGNTVFLTLDDVAEGLPPLDEQVVTVDMDPELAEAYKFVEDKITEALRRLMFGRKSKLLGTMLHTLLGWPDRPWGWGEIGYNDIGKDGVVTWNHVCDTPDLPQHVVRNKEDRLLADIGQEVAAGRKVWVYAVMTQKRDVQPRLAQLIRDQGHKCDVLKASVKAESREAWIKANAPANDVLISHPQLVETGLDFFDKLGTYNIPSIFFYQTGYSTFTVRQAARRAYRIGQQQPCKVRYYFYDKTLQARAMTLMGKKLQASQTIEGKFSSDGLAAMAGDEGSLEIALAKSLIEKLDDLDVGRVWGKVKA